MGRKKYFCDYCLKSFNDDPKARTLHLNSFRHLQLKEEHYQAFKDAKTLLQEESTKEPCLKFQREGYCHFGTSCRYSHLLPHELDNLRAEVEGRNQPQAPSLTFKEWWAQKSHSRGMENRPGTSHEVKVPVSSLPISLRPFDIAEFKAGYHHGQLRVFITQRDKEAIIWLLSYLSKKKYALCPVCIFRLSIRVLENTF